MMSSTDLPLTEKGVRQAQAAMEYLQGNIYGYVYSSPLIRAKQTAAIISGKETGMVIRDELREMNLGRCEGLTWKERYEFYGDIDCEHNLPQAAFPEGEDYADVFARCKAFVMNDLAQIDKDASALVVAHGITIRVLINCIMGKPDHCVNYINWPDNTAITEIDWRADCKILVRLNDMGHLTASGLMAPKYDIWGAFSKTDYLTV